MRRLLPLLLLLACDEPAQRRDEAIGYGASYPDGTRGVALLVDMLDDDDASVRKAAAESLAALGRRGLSELTRYLSDPKEPSRAAFLDIGQTLGRMGAAVTASDLVGPLAASESPLARRAGVAGAAFACWWHGHRDPVIDVVMEALQDRDKTVSAMAPATLALLGWAAVADKHPASAADVKDLAPLIVAPAAGDWVSCIAAATVSVLRPPAAWPKHVADYHYASEQREPVPDATDLGELRKTLMSFVESAPGRGDDWKRSSDLDRVLRSLRSRKAAAAPAAPELARLLANERGRSRVEVARTVLVVDADGIDAAAKALGDVLREPDHSPAERALAVLAEMGPAARQVVPALVEVLAWPEEGGSGEDLAGECARMGSAFQFRLRSKRAAASLLGHLGAKEAVPALTALAGHEDARLRYRAATALRRIGAG